MIFVGKIWPSPRTHLDNPQFAVDVRFLLLFPQFSDLRKWLAFHQGAVPQVKLFVTVVQEQAMSMVMVDQSPNVLAADIDSGSVRDFLC